MKSFVRVRRDDVPKLVKSLENLSDLRVLVGVPEAANNRTEQGISNAELAYIHNFGAPEAHIPQREFMAPGVKDVQPEIVERLKAASTMLLTDQDATKLLSNLSAVGLLAQNAIKKRIQSNIPPPLAYSTILGRIRRRADKGWRRKRRALVDANIATGKDPGEGIFTALIDTGGLINAITFVVRSIKTGKDKIVGAYSKAAS